MNRSFADGVPKKPNFNWQIDDKAGAPMFHV